MANTSLCILYMHSLLKYTYIYIYIYIYTRKSLETVIIYLFRGVFKLTLLYIYVHILMCIVTQLLCTEFYRYLLRSKYNKENRVISLRLSSLDQSQQPEKIPFVQHIQKKSQKKKKKNRTEQNKYQLWISLLFSHLFSVCSSSS